ncbi:MAG: YeeE/YedE family protein [Gemmatimonadota bacterium]|nr:YeeE/YedE family protein [Gemmatimonadota bacterium]
MDLLTRPWPWYVAGPIIGLAVPLVYLYAGRKWGISSTFRDVCAATLPRDLDYFRYSWRAQGGWRLTMALGLIFGGFVAGVTRSTDVAVSEATRADLTALGITDFTGLVPAELFAWSALGTVPGIVLIVGGGFLVGFGTRYANGCTSGHAISGLSALRVTSFVAVLGFFAGGLIATHLLLPVLLGGGS